MKYLDKLIYRVVIKFFSLDDLSPTEIELLKVYEEPTLSF